MTLTLMTMMDEMKDCGFAAVVVVPVDVVVVVCWFVKKNTFDGYVFYY